MHYSGNIIPLTEREIIGPNLSRHCAWNQIVKEAFVSGFSSKSGKKPVPLGFRFDANDRHFTQSVTTRHARQNGIFRKV